MPIPLCPAHLLSLDGTDAVAFAHAQFTSDVRALPVGAWQWSAWLDAQGRTRMVFALLRPQAERLVAWQPLGDAPAMRDALRRFLFRSAVRIETIDGWSVHRAADAPPAAHTLTLHDDGYLLALPGSAPRAAWLGPRTGEGDPVALSAWRREDIAASLPLLPASLGAEFVPQALDLERIDAIRFDKGCYPGQEIAARLHFRGGNKRHLHRATVQGDIAIEPADELFDQTGSVVGKVLYAADPPTQRALVVLVDGSPRTLAMENGAKVAID